MNHLPLSSVSVKIVSKGATIHPRKTPQRTNTTNDKQTQRLAFPTYNEEDILNWDVAITPPPPRRSGTIRVKLRYNGRSKPMLVEDPW